MKAYAKAHALKRDIVYQPEVGGPILDREEAQYVFRRSNFKGTDKILVVLGSIFTRDKQSYILKALKKYLKESFAMPFEIYFHRSQTDLNCQLADYFGWAIDGFKWVDAYNGSLKSYWDIRGFDFIRFDGIVYKYRGYCIDIYLIKL